MVENARLERDVAQRAQMPVETVALEHHEGVRADVGEPLEELLVAGEFGPAGTEDIADRGIESEMGQPVTR